MKPGGLLLVHTIGSVVSSPTLRLPEREWINREIFPGGVVPSFGQIASASDSLFTLLDAQEFGPYYDLTLIAWNENFERGWPEIQHLYDARFYRIMAVLPAFLCGRLQGGKQLQALAGSVREGLSRRLQVGALEASSLHMQRPACPILRPHSLFADLFVNFTSDYA